MAAQTGCLEMLKEIGTPGRILNSVGPRQGQDDVSAWMGGWYAFTKITTTCDRMKKAPTRFWEMLGWKTTRSMQRCQKTGKTGAGDRTSQYKSCSQRRFLFGHSSRRMGFPRRCSRRIFCAGNGPWLDSSGTEKNQRPQLKSVARQLYLGEDPAITRIIESRYFQMC